MSIKTGLEFAPGTTPDCRQLVERLCDPNDLLGAYRVARNTFQTNDIVLTFSVNDGSGFVATTRGQWVKQYRDAMPPHAMRRMPVLTIETESAHKRAKLPFEGEAVWLVLYQRQQMPLTIVVYAAPYKIDAVAD